LVTTNVLPTINMMVGFQKGDYSATIYLLNVSNQPGQFDRVTYNVTLALAQSSGVFLNGQTIEETIKSGPNPANPDEEPVHIGFILEKESKVKIRVYSLGRELVYEKNKTYQGGYNEAIWDGEDLFNDKVANGVYLAFIEIDTGSEKIKKVLKIAILR
jgi:hypothetical protein